jgi:hypothetical protein
MWTSLKAAPRAADHAIQHFLRRRPSLAGQSGGRSASQLYPRIAAPSESGRSSVHLDMIATGPRRSMR